MSVWTKAWVGWSVALAALIVFFAVVEGWALARNLPGDTLSEQVWNLREKGSWLYWFILDVITIACFTFAWLLFHFRFQSGRVAP